MSDPIKPVRRIVTIDDEQRQVGSDRRRAVARRAHRSGAPGLCLDAHLGHRRDAGDGSSSIRDALTLPHTIEPPPTARSAASSPSRRTQLPRQGRRERGRGVLSSHGLAAASTYSRERAASLHAEDAHARFLPDPGRRDHAGARHRGGARWRPATRWCSAAPTTPGAIARDRRAPSRSHRTTPRIEVALRT